MSKIFKLFFSFFLILLIILPGFIINNSFALEPDEILKNPKLEQRARDISKNIRCMVCQNQSIDDSSAPLARDLRILIRNKIKNGENDNEIYNFLTERYGDFILLKPKIQFNTLALWFLPIFFFLTGILIIFKKNKKKS
tara:strand:- start:63 stop:479 length:417 start_codon:yes stop_codon:yes gene_type:complete